MAYAFCRVSTSSQSNGVSLSLQEKEINRVAKELNWNISKCEKVTGSAYKKDPFDFAYSRLKNKKLLFYSVDRFSRNVLHATAMVDTLLLNKNVLYFIKEKLKVDTRNSPESTRLFNYIMLAENESKLISDRVSASKQYIKEQGIYNGGVVPFGYRVETKNSNKYLVRDENDNYIIKFIIDCKTPGTTIETLNKSLYFCGGNTIHYPISLGDDGYSCDELETDLTYKCIAELLTEYNIYNTSWTESKVSSIYRKFKPASVTDMDVDDLSYDIEDMEIDSID